MLKIEKQQRRNKYSKGIFFKDFSFCHSFCSSLFVYQLRVRTDRRGAANKKAERHEEVATSFMEKSKTSKLVFITCVYAIRPVVICALLRLIDVVVLIAWETGDVCRHFKWNETGQKTQGNS